ncbi:vacuolar alkaline phosphatase [Recurvomyces mirabilis]|nr:vacuolar alkaline phosphatase [Recurvomyces mirabilis]
MARGQEPLVARGPPSDGSDDIEEEDALLTGQRTNKQAPSSNSVLRSRWKDIALFTWALLATAAVIVLAVVYQHSRTESPGGDGKIGSGHDRPSGKRNLIFMVSDGMGPTSLALTRSWRQYTEQLPYDQTLLLDEYLIGQSRTRSSSSLVTDSAAGATAFSCGHKSYNGAISVLPDHSPCGSVMEAAKRIGYTTGLVVTTRITDATPAVFASHVRRREMEDEIALQMIGDTHPLGRIPDLMLGGGRCHFLPNSTGDESCRNDDVDVRKVAGDIGWDYISTRKQFDGLGTNPKLPLMGLFAYDDIPYEIDRQYQGDTYPSLEEMTRTALDALSAATADEDEGFFIMIEGSRIDHAGHGNDPAAQVHEVLAYDHAMAAVLEFVKDSATPTLMVATSDHETGGLALAKQLHPTYPAYLWYPGVLANVTHSASHTSHEYHDYLFTSPLATNMRSWLTTLLSESLGIHDPSPSEIASLIDHPALASYTFADMISRRAQTGWSTHGHSGADVNIYSSDPVAARKLVGNHENTEVGDFLRWYLGAEDEVEKVTKTLRKHLEVTDDAAAEGKVWLGTVPESSERLDGQDHMDHYVGDHKKRGEHEGCEVCRR